jgi:hypothetical protein
MTRQAYPGLANPDSEFEKLRPLVAELRRMQTRCRPFGADYHAIAVALNGLETAAFHFTRRPHYYSDGGRQS